MVRNDKGMSLMSVLFALLILSATAVTGYLAIPPIMEETNSQITLKRMATLQNAIRSYREHNGGSGPPTLDQLVTPGVPACSVDADPASPTYKTLQGWCGPYLDLPLQQDMTSFQRDGWGTLLQFTPTELKSCGSNRSCGDGDDITIAI